MPASRNVGNNHAAGRRVKRDRIKLDLSLSERNGLLDLASRYLSEQGIPPEDKQIREFASDWFYANFGDWLKRQIETNDAVMIV